MVRPANRRVPGNHTVKVPAGDRVFVVKSACLSKRRNPVGPLCLSAPGTKDPSADPGAARRIPLTLSAFRTQGVAHSDHNQT